MPSYFNISAEWEKIIKEESFLLSIYNSLFSNGFTFKSVLEWGCSGDLSINDIITWNQEKLNKRFRLGYSEDVSNDYRQFYLSHSLFDNIRVITDYSLHISIIVPEYDIYQDEYNPTNLIDNYNMNRIDALISLSESLWDTNLFVSIQTYPELGGNTPYKKLQKGELPSIEPFAILDEKTFRRGNYSKYHVEERNGSFLIQLKE